jgi:hypothetical protein
MSLRDFGLGIGNIRVAGIFPNSGRKGSIKVEASPLSAGMRALAHRTAHELADELGSVPKPLAGYEAE